MVSGWSHKPVRKPRGFESLPCHSIKVRNNIELLLNNTQDNCMKHYLVYKITNTINNMIYIGVHETQKVDDNYMGSGKYLQNAQKKYGLKNFKKEILFECSSREDMLQKEIDLVDEAFISRLDTYNSTIGGYGGGFYYANKNGLNHKVNQHKIVHSKIKNDPDYAEWFSKKVSTGLYNYTSKHPENPNGWIGKKHNEQSKRKIGEANSQHQQGEKNSQYGTMWITNGVESKKIKKDDIMPDGWKKGRKIKHN